MTLDQIKKRVGKNIKYYDDTNGWLASRDVTETDIQDFVNEIYTEEMFPLFASRWPHLFRQVATLDSWVMTATVNASSTGTTLVIDTSVTASFSNSMEGLVVYNSTDDESTTITDYTSTSTVTVEDTIGNTWDGDTIYVLGQEFGIGGDATDIFAIESVAIKYASDDTFFRKAEMRDKQDLLPLGNETGSKTLPYVYLTSILDGGNMYNAIGIFPAFDVKLSKAIEINYIAKPAAITGAGITPIIPIHESLICGATMRAYEKKQDFNAAAYWQVKYERAQKREISRFRPQTSNRPTDIKLNRNLYYLFKRSI